MKIQCNKFSKYFFTKSLSSSGKGLVYKSSGDCFMKTVNGEGFLGTFNCLFYRSGASIWLGNLFLISEKSESLELTCLFPGSPLQRLSTLLATHGAVVSNFLAFLRTGSTNTSNILFIISPHFAHLCFIRYVVTPGQLLGEGQPRIKRKSSRAT